MFDSYPDQPFEEGDRVFGYELFERDQECALKGHEALDGSWASIVVSKRITSPNIRSTYCSGVEVMMCQTA